MGLYSIWLTEISQQHDLARTCVGRSGTTVSSFLDQLCKALGGEIEFLSFFYSCRSIRNQKPPRCEFGQDLLQEDRIEHTNLQNYSRQKFLNRFGDSSV
jgi:hypothetical protein